MTYEEAIDVLHGWVGRQVIATLLTELPNGAASGTPMEGTLEITDLWPEDDFPDLDPAENPQRLGEVEGFTVVPPKRRPELVNPEGTTFAIYRSIFGSALVLEAGRGLTLKTQGPIRLEFWLDD